MTAASAAQTQQLNKFFSYQGRDILDVVESLSRDEFDGLPMGALLLDSSAKIIGYNETEARITGRDKNAVIGKNFFLDLAACGVGPHFHGRFKSGIMKAEFDQTFPYVFYHDMPETAMLVRMALSKNPKHLKCMWVFVRRLMPG
jgi:photoactive yellow protein